MRVKFKRTFFGPSKSRFRPDVWYSVPDSWAKPGEKKKYAGLPDDVEIDDSVIVPEELVAAEPAKSVKKASSIQV